MKKYIFLFSLFFYSSVFSQSPVGAQNIEPQNVQPQNVQPQSSQQSTQENQPQQIEKPQQQSESSNLTGSSTQKVVNDKNEASKYSTLIGILLTLFVFIIPFFGSIKTRRHS